MSTFRTTIERSATPRPTEAVAVVVRPTATPAEDTRLFS